MILQSIIFQYFKMTDFGKDANLRNKIWFHFYWILFHSTHNFIDFPAINAIIMYSEMTIDSVQKLNPYLLIIIDHKN